MATLTYYRPVVLDNYIFMSCDMLRLKFNMSEFQLKNFNRFINEELFNNNNLTLNKFFNVSKFKYRNLIVISDVNTKNSFSVGLCFNDLTKTTNGCFIEFNPNKTLDEYGKGLVQPFLEYVKQNSSHLELVRYDLALDIPVSKEYISLDKDMRKYTKFFVTDVENNYSDIVSDMQTKTMSYRIDVKSRDLNNCTEYLGQRNKAGFTKLYNKQIESNLEKPITRLEITMDTLSYSDFVRYLPNVCTYKKVDVDLLDNLNDTEKVLLKLLQQNSNCDLYLKQLGRKMQDKLKKILCNEDSILKVSDSEYYQLVNNIMCLIN